MKIPPVHVFVSSLCLVRGPCVLLIMAGVVALAVIKVKPAKVQEMTRYVFPVPRIVQQRIRRMLLPCQLLLIRPRRNLRNPQFHPRINPRIVQLRFVMIGNAVGLLMKKGLHHHQVGVVLRVKRGRVDHTTKLLANLVNPVVMVAVAPLGVARLRDHQLGVQVVIPSIVLLQAVNLARAEIVIYALPRRKINVSYGTVM